MITFIEKKEDEQIVTGIVLQPDVVDAQSDKISAPEIVKARKAFQDAKAIFLQHTKKVAKKDFDIVEDYIAKEDTEIGDEKVRKGSWILSVKIHSSDIWKEVKAGKLTGFSIKGMAKRMPVAA